MLHPDIEFLAFLMVVLVTIKYLCLMRIYPKRLSYVRVFVGLFEWVVMTFGLKNASATYQRAMNLIFHALLGIVVEVYVDDIVVKSAGDDSHLADLRLAFEKMCRYKLKMNPLKCAFGVSAGKFLGFIVHEKGIEIDPKKIEAIQSVKHQLVKRIFKSSWAR
jgi:hypothetical protein